MRMLSAAVVAVLALAMALVFIRPLRVKLCTVVLEPRDKPASAKSAVDVGDELAEDVCGAARKVFATLKDSAGELAERALRSEGETLDPARAAHPPIEEPDAEGPEEPAQRSSDRPGATAVALKRSTTFGPNDERNTPIT